MRLEVVKDESAQHKFTALQGTTSHMAYHSDDTPQTILGPAIDES
jgi:hypothetical protein